LSSPPDIFFKARRLRTPNVSSRSIMYAPLDEEGYGEASKTS
jgi:hypothetical protein